jgi:hypothetical protein
MLTIAWYAQGVRVLDISGLATYQGSPADVALGNGVGMREVGHYVMADSDTWSFKTNRINRDGSFFGYGNDLVRGFDVYRFRGFRNKTVPELRPRDLATRIMTPTSGGTRALVPPLAALVPALVGVGLIRRRTARIRPRV